MEDVLARVSHGALTPAAVAAVDRAIADLRGRLQASTRGESNSELARGRRFLADLAGSAQMLHEPAAMNALAALGAQADWSVGDLLGLMQRHHLQFGPAESAAERGRYRDLYSLMGAAARPDRVE